MLWITVTEKKTLINIKLHIINIKILFWIYVFSKFFLSAYICTRLCSIFWVSSTLGARCERGNKIYLISALLELTFNLKIILNKFLTFYTHFQYVFNGILEKERGIETSMRDKHPLVPPACLPLGSEPTTMACALNGNQLNRWPLGTWNGVQPTEPQQLGNNIMLTLHLYQLLKTNNKN